MPSFPLRAAVALIAVALAGPIRAEAPAPYTNRLIHSADPYLLLHAHNPVDWYPWGPEAFAKAKAEGKPIFLSVGYSTCYWCHVAEKTIYSDPAIAKLMNEWFVNVKVDREERPDVDRLYMDATSMLTGHGAWPNNVFMTPDGAPFYAGSYFPPKDDGDTPGFPKVLAAIHDLWVNHRAEQVTPAADEMMKALRKLATQQDQEGTLPVVPRAWLSSATQMLLPGIDPEHGGLGSPKAGPKFPQAPALALLAADARIDGDGAAGAALTRTLDGMAYGGVDDQLGGGFFRYATDPAWSVPHFEKMLTDNAQLLALYTAQAKTTGGALDAEVALATARFLSRDMQLAGGGFATALDAETDGVEGATYTWTRQQIEDALGTKDTESFLGIYELTPLPDQRGGEASVAGGPPPGVLRVRLPIADTLHRAGFADPATMLSTVAPLRATLLAARAARPQPARDDKVVSGWNGLAIGALAKAGAVFASPGFTTAAIKAAARIWDQAYDTSSGALKHQIFEGTAAVDGTPEDYAALGVGYLDLAEATKDDVWHQRAETLADAMLKRFLQPDGRLQAGAGLLPVALGDNEDADMPSGTSSALVLLGRLAARPDGARFGVAQAKMATRLAGTIGAHPTTWPSAVVALAENPPSPADLAAAAPAKTPGTPVKVAATAEPQIPATADHVRATAKAAPGVDGEIVTVTLDVDPGYHVNAHVPSLDYLVPTDLAVTGAKVGAVTYPAAQMFKPEFSKTPLAVYEGAVKLTATLPRDATGWHATITAQACDAHTCLPPSTLPVDLTSRPRG